MANKKTNKQKYTNPQHRTQTRTSTRSARLAMLEVWMNNNDKNQKQNNNTIMLNRVLSTIQNKLVDALQLPEYVGVQALPAPTGTVYALRRTPHVIGEPGGLEVVQASVEAITRSLNIRIPMDCIPQAENEAVQVAVMEISQGFNNEFMDLIYQNSTATDFRINTSTDTPQDAIAKIMKACTMVARNSGRGNANKVIIPLDVYGLIQQHMVDMQWFSPSDNNQTLSDLAHVGTLFGVADIYVSTRNTVVLVGYKGSGGEIDASIVFCPHKISANLTINPCTFELHISMDTFHGRYVADNATDYHANIQVR